jgi:hypothetical protein
MMSLHIKERSKKPCTRNAIEKTSIKERQNVKFIKENIRYRSPRFSVMMFI